jgi:hypothetical protein
MSYVSGMLQNGAYSSFLSRMFLVLELVPESEEEEGSFHLFF